MSADALPDLLFLTLNGQQKVTDAGIDSLIGQKRHFASLDLDRTGVTDAGLKRIIEEKLTDRIIRLPEDTSDEVRQLLAEAGMIDDD